MNSGSGHSWLFLFGRERAKESNPHGQMEQVALCGAQQRILPRPFFFLFYNQDSGHISRALMIKISLNLVLIPGLLYLPVPRHLLV